MTVALMAAAAIMAALALLSLPFSPGLTIASNDQTDSDDGLTGSDRGSGSTTDLDGTTAAGTGAGGSNGSGVPIDDNTRFTVAVDRATGETTPIAVDPDSGRAFAFDPETDETIPLSFDPAGSSNGDSGLLVPVGVDRTTGEVGIVGIVDRETGQVGIIGGTDSGVDLGELDPATLDGLVEVAGGDLENVGVIGSIDPGRQPDGQIDFSAFDFGDVEIGGPTGGDPENLDWNRIGRELDQAEIDDAGAGDARIDDTAPGDTAPGDAAPDATDGGSDTANRINDRRSFDGRNLGVIVQAALLMLAVIFVLRLRRWRPTTRGRHRRPARPDLPVDAHDAEAGLTASLHAVTDTGDPRERIIAAYTRLLEALDAAGAPRLAHEAPHEHLDRVLTPLGVRPEPVHRLAELFVMARFSDHPITEHHRTAAADALRLSLASLREATDLATAADSGTEQRAAAGTSKR